MIDDEITKTVEDLRRARANDEALQQLSDFYDEMKRSGIAQSHGYNLPPVDTVGNTAYRHRR
jgi:hypothetical protein